MPSLGLFQIFYHKVRRTGIEAPIAVAALDLADVRASADGAVRFIRPRDALGAVSGCFGIEAAAGVDQYLGATIHGNYEANPSRMRPPALQFGPRLGANTA